MSLLGLNDRPGDVSYLLRDERSSRHVLRKVVLLAVLAGLSTVAYFQWRPLYQENSGILKQAKSAVASVFGNWLQRKTSSPEPDAGKTAAAAVIEDKNAGAKSSENGLDEATPSALGEQAPSTSAEPVATREQAVTHAGATDVSLTASRKTSFSVARAQQFLRGKGVPQNCEQALLYLRSAARRNDPQAAVQMGALYSTGHCVDQDRVMAYRWLNSARQQEPANPWIQQDLDQLWARMTPMERRQIVD